MIKTARTIADTLTDWTLYICVGGVRIAALWTIWCSGFSAAVPAAVPPAARTTGISALAVVVPTSKQYKVGPDQHYMQ